jgi:hypothetical protein
MATLLDELNEVIVAFDNGGIEYAVRGGLAMAINGFARATLDIDLLIQAESLEKTFQVSEKIGYDIHDLDISF